MAERECGDGQPEREVSSRGEPVAGGLSREQTMTRWMQRCGLRKTRRAVLFVASLALLGFAQISPAAADTEESKYRNLRDIDVTGYGYRFSEWGIVLA